MEARGGKRVREEAGKNNRVGRKGREGAGERGTVKIARVGGKSAYHIAFWNVAGVKNKEGDF